MSRSMDSAAMYSTLQLISTEKMQETILHHLQTVQANSLNKQEDNKHIPPLRMSIQQNGQVHQFNCKVNLGAGCNIMPLYIYMLLFKDQRPEPPTVLISGYGDSLISKPRVMYSSAPHWMSDTTESCFPSHGNKRVPYSWS